MGNWDTMHRCSGDNINKVELRLVHGKKGTWGIVPSKVNLILPLFYFGFN